MNRTVVAVLLVIGGLLGLFMTACGGFFTIGGLFDNGRDAYLRGAMVMSVPSLLVGVLLCRFVWKRYRMWQGGGDVALAGNGAMPLVVVGSGAAILIAGMVFGVMRLSFIVAIAVVVMVAAFVVTAKRQSAATRIATPDDGRRQDGDGKDGDGREGDEPLPPPAPPA